MPLQWRLKDRNCQKDVSCDQTLSLQDSRSETLSVGPVT
jgi:hypothetical protein